MVGRLDDDLRRLRALTEQASRGSRPCRRRPPRSRRAWTTALTVAARIVVTPAFGVRRTAFTRLKFSTSRLITDCPSRSLPHSLFVDLFGDEHPRLALRTRYRPTRPSADHHRPRTVDESVWHWQRETRHRIDKHSPSKCSVPQTYRRPLIAGSTPDRRVATRRARQAGSRRHRQATDPPASCGRGHHADAHARHDRARRAGVDQEPAHPMTRQGWLG